MKKLSALMSLFIIAGCQSTAPVDDIVTDLSNLYASEGYLASAEEGHITWKNKEGYNIYTPAETIQINYYPASQTEFLQNKIKDKDFVKFLSIAQQYLSDNLEVNKINTRVYANNGLIRHGYSDGKNVCLISTPFSDLYADKDGNGHITATIGCGSAKNVDKEAKKIVPIYKDLESSEDIVLIIKNEIDNKYFRLNGYSLFGGGGESIVVKTDKGYEHIYGGNSGDIPCKPMYEYDVPVEMYGECY